MHCGTTRVARNNFTVLLLLLPPTKLQCKAAADSAWILVTEHELLVNALYS